MLNRKLKVLVLFSSSGIGGAERSLSRMALSNTDNAIAYQLATYSNKGSWSKWVLSKNGNPVCFNHSVWKLVKYIYAERPNFIYVIGFRISVLLRIFKLFSPRIKIIQGVRWNPCSNVLLDKIFRIVEKIFGFLLDGYIVNSDSARKTLFKLVKNKVSLIYNGISEIPKLDEKKTSNKNIITVANLSDRKGYQEYINAISIVIKIEPESQFLFIGKDNLNGEIQRLIINKKLENNVKYLGFKEKINHLLEESAIFVLPSLYGEGCPTSILEAFSFSLPVVAYNIDGIPELVTHDVDGLLYDVGDIHALAQGIISLLLNPKKSKEMGISGYQKVKDYFLLDDMLKNHNDFFLEFK